jgi:hypothetical protein
MQDKVILDRSFAYLLVAYLEQMEGQTKNSPFFSSEHSALIEYAGNVINWAAILFEKILIENSFGTSLYRLTRCRLFIR